MSVNGFDLIGVWFGLNKCWFDVVGCGFESIGIFVNSWLSCNMTVVGSDVIRIGGILCAGMHKKWFLWFESLKLTVDEFVGFDETDILPKF